MVRLPADFPPTISFTFDDVPDSALAFGHPIMRSAGIVGTWYIATALLGQPSPVGMVASAQGVADLHAAGHEIGNHTCHHLNASHVPAAIYAEDIRHNRAELSRLLPGAALRSFSYPYGAVTAPAKRVAMAQATTCRGIIGGIVRSRVDLALLPANKLYSRSVPLASVERLIESVRRGGWAILYTHDVTPEPSAWGCTPDYFAAVVAAVARAGLAVRTIGDVAAQLAPPCLE